MGSKLNLKRKYKKKRKQRPVIKITSDHISIVSVILDAGILILLIIWFFLEMNGLI